MGRAGCDGGPVEQRSTDAARFVGEGQDAAKAAEVVGREHHAVESRLVKRGVEETARPILRLYARSLRRLRLGGRRRSPVRSVDVLRGRGEIAPHETARNDAVHRRSGGVKTRQICHSKKASKKQVGDTVEQSRREE